jgi:CYTH domain-containing protein
VPGANVEIERKYLLSALPRFPAPLDVLEVDQGYIPGTNVLERLRRQRHADGRERYFRTMKLGSGVERAEFEDETDRRTFEHLWVLTAGARLTKRRHIVANGADHWEIDEFTDRPLVLAELEIPSADTTIVMPDWLTAVLVREVTEEKSYSNRSLAR